MKTLKRVYNYFRYYNIRKRFYAFVAIMLLVGCAPIQNNIKSFSKTDIAYQATYIALTAVDMAQTHWMAKNDWQFNGHNHYEVCPLFFNSKPHQDAVDILIPAGVSFHTGIAFILPPKAKVFDFEINPRRIWQVMFIGIEAGMVTNNAIIGARIEF